MKLAVMGGGQPAGVVEVSDPKVADNYALVKIHSAPLCTEFKWRNREKRAGFGHEAAGEVVEIGPNVRHVAIGDRVVVMPQNSCGLCELCLKGEHIFCRSPRKALEICGCENGRETTAQFLVQQDWLLVKIPDGIAYDHAAMACCGFGPGFNAMQSMNVGAGDTVLVSGLGPVGLGTMTVALYRGARVFGLDVSDYRRALAMKLGAEGVFNPTDEDVKEQIHSATGGRGIDKSVDTSGAASAPGLLIAVVRATGHLAFIAHRATVEIGPVVGKGLTLHGCWHWNHLTDATRMMATIRGSADRISKIITHTFGLAGVQQAFDLQVAGQCGKIIIHPWE